MNMVSELPEELHAQIRERVAVLVGEIDSPTGAGILSVWLGSAVESGADPEINAGPLLESFLKLTQRVETTDEDSDEDDDLIDEELVAGLEYAGQGLVAHLVRLPKKRLAFAQHHGVTEELARVSHMSAGALWVQSILTQRSGKLIVIHAEEKVGVEVTFHNLSNCFHLFTLLQAAVADFMPGAKTVDAEVIATASGQEYSDVHDSAWWHYGQPNSNEPNIAASVFGEGGLDSIGTVDDQQAMLLWKPILANRSWNGFFGPPIMAAMPDVTVDRQLSNEEVSLWSKKLGLPSN